MGVSVSVVKFSEVAKGERFVFLTDIERHRDLDTTEFIKVYVKTGDFKYTIKDAKDMEYAIGSNQLWVVPLPKEGKVDDA